MSQDDATSNNEDPAQVIISGAGIVGLVLALALHKHVGIMPEIYEQAPAFHDGVGAAIGMYPNGLRVIRDISPFLLKAILKDGFPYEYRRWMRHDGTEVAVAKETALSRRDDDLHSIGIRRWKLQKILFDTAVEAGIPIHFGKRTTQIEVIKHKKTGSSIVECSFEDGTSRRTNILFGADGSSSKTRDFVIGSSCIPKYTGTTCLFGISNWPRPQRGICFPSACNNSTKCHACFFPTGEHEQCFQFHFPVKEEKTESWGLLNKEQGQKDCSDLADQLLKEGWDKQFLEPLHRVDHVVRFGFSLLDPGLERWVRGPVVLLGDAAHPPVPYIGQGAQMGIEDAGVIAELLGKLCVNKNGSFDPKNFGGAMRVYEQMRIPRTGQILNNSKFVGREQQRRANNKYYNVARESSVRLQVMMHGTLPIYMAGVKYDYREEVAKVILQVKINHYPMLFSSQVRVKNNARMITEARSPSKLSLGFNTMPTQHSNALPTILEGPSSSSIGEEDQDSSSTARIIISGAGMSGLMLALSLVHDIGIMPEVYEQAASIDDSAEAGVVLHQTSLHIIKKLSPSILKKIQDEGLLYGGQTWMKCDGTRELVISQDNSLSKKRSENGIGICLSQVKKALLEALLEAGINIHFGKRILSVKVGENDLIKCTFDDGTTKCTEILFGADGNKSTVRNFVSKSDSELKSAGVQCLTGLTSTVPTEEKQVYPSVCTPTCHCCYFPTKSGEQCFQFHFPVGISDKDCLATPSTKDTKEKYSKLRSRLREEGWDEKLLVPLDQASCLKEYDFYKIKPRLEKWSSGPVVLLGEAAHPTIPYIGQNVELCIEDAATISHLLKILCIGEGNTFDKTKFEQAMVFYEELRSQRTSQIMGKRMGLERTPSYTTKGTAAFSAGNLSRRKSLGLKDKASSRNDPMEFWRLFRCVLPAVFPGREYNPEDEVRRLLQEEKTHRQNLLNKRWKDKHSPVPPVRKNIRVSSVA